MADRDPFILSRLAAERAAALLAAADRGRRTTEPGRRLRRTAGLALVRLGEALVGVERRPALALSPAGVTR